MSLKGDPADAKAPDQTVRLTGWEWMGCLLVLATLVLLGWGIWSLL